MKPELILVVDDEPGMVRAVTRVLEDRYRVAGARSAEQAIRLAEKHKPDVAILDIRMPVMDGFALLRRLREACPDLDVIFMTGVVHELDAQLIRSIREKAYYFVQKPFDREVLLTLVQRCCELRRLAHDNRDHVRRLEDELGEARRFQRSLLPGTRAVIHDLGIAASYEPCSELGGDLYDYVDSGDGDVAVLIADVSGHGVSAAMFTAIVKSCFRDARSDAFEPSCVVRRIAGGIRSFHANRFVTLICARLSLGKGRMEYINAGHPPALLWGERQERRLIEPTGPLVSPALPDATWEQASVPLASGDQLLLYTDGITEACGAAGDELGDQRLFDAAVDGRRHGPGLIEDLLATLRDFGGDRPAADDRTLLTVSTRPH